MTETGKVFWKSAVQTGVSQSGTSWSRMTVVIEIETQYGSRKVALDVGGTKISFFDHINIGDKVEVGYIVSAREWQGKWYNSVSLVTLRELGKPAAQYPATAPGAAAPQQGNIFAGQAAAAPARPATTPLPPVGPDEDEDLPF